MRINTMRNTNINNKQSANRTLQTDKQNEDTENYYAQALTPDYLIKYAYENQTPTLRHYRQPRPHHNYTPKKEIPR